MKRSKHNPKSKPNPNITDQNAQTYRDAIEAVGLNLITAGPFLDVTERTSRTYAALGAPDVVTMLLKVMIRYRVNVSDVNRLMNRI